MDADANANLNEVLGLTVSDTLGNAREEMKKGIVPSGMTKDVFMSMKLEQAIAESAGYDLVVMGQPEGAGCYCAANTLLTGFLERLTGNYPYVVMDNEAGMEHISRLTTNNVDVLLIVSDTSRRGVQAAFENPQSGQRTEHRGRKEAVWSSTRPKTAPATRSCRCWPETTWNWSARSRRTRQFTNTTPRGAPPSICPKTAPPSRRHSAFLTKS